MSMRLLADARGFDMNETESTDARRNQTESTDARRS
jgi:hypothetical protein